MKLILSLAIAGVLMGGSLPPCGIANAAEAYQRGCCSHHGGVCGCKNGRTVCCDKTFSPTCRC
ncbi:hypothetical protein ACMGDH_11335 [Sphingomonas sp. DT-207]